MSNPLVEAMLNINEADEFTTILARAANADETLKEVAKRQHEADQEREVCSLKTLLESAARTKKLAVKRIRGYRKGIRDDISIMDNIDRAIQFGSQTANWCPLIALISPLDFAGMSKEKAKELTVIPEVWSLRK